MGNPNPNYSTRFQKGICYNPGGVPRKVPEELKHIKVLTSVIAQRLISKHAYMDADENASFLANRKNSMVELTIASIFQKSFKQGDFSRLSFLLDRCIGKVKEMPEDDETSNAQDEMKKLTLNELFHIIKTNLPETKAG